MTSEKQIQANRRNAHKSTGPKTPEGKAAVRLNSNKHGLRSQEVLLPGEDEEALGIDRESHPGSARRVPSRYDAQGLLDALGFDCYRNARRSGVYLD